MASNIIKLDPLHPDMAAIAYAGECIRAGKIVAFPTETVYGLGANALDAHAVQKIYRVKRRPSSDPAIVHLATPADLSEIARDVPELAHRLAEQFWPGPLTMILTKQDIVPDCVTASMPTVGVRVPSHPIAAALIQAAGVPIAAPSANLFMQTSATTAAHVWTDLGENVDLILDAGEATIGIESTVIAVNEGEVRLLRPGAVSWEEIGRIITELGEETRLTVGAENASQSPGLAKKHYSPRAHVMFFHGPAEASRHAMLTAVTQELAQGHQVGLLLSQEDLPAFRGFANKVKIENLGAENDLATVAHRLYAAMRHLDELGVDVILGHSFGADGLGRALLDQLTRAAEGQVIDTKSTPI